ncbi:hypothetical protein [Gulosibacter sp. 10]|uniref:hypothetical protein n=1 Tax=Gulosibacter sp. 10 TaxID=1255570 RepID=UPI00097F1283|nr:hypothetical protein [Gulosibacter sp. 10]SJM56605.1 hypothetical protein FM112_04740 [Gulosibacter sp. 10]
MDAAEAQEIAQRVHSLAARYHELLDGSGIGAEAVGEYRPPQRRLLRTRPARIVEVTRGWRLGVLLVDVDDRLRASGATLRAHEPPPVLGYPSESARERDALRHAAIRGGFAEGEPVHYDTFVIGEERLRTCSGPIVLRDGEAAVRWHRDAPVERAVPLERYLRERAALLLDPSRGAT